MAGPIRAFFAVEIKNKNLIYEISRLQKKLSHIVSNLKLVELENIHLTLRFIGDISEETARKLYDFLENEINSQYFQEGSLEFVVKKLNDFSKRVFHVNIEGPVSVLRDIHDKIDGLLVKTYGFQPDRKFASHITIARARKQRNTKQKAIFPTQEYNQLKNEYGSQQVLGNFIVPKIYLKRSVLTPKGPIYSNIEF